MRLLWAFLVSSVSLFSADIAIAPQSLTFAWQAQSQSPPPEQGILLTSPDNFTFTVTRPAGDGWLVLPSQTNVATGKGPVFLPIDINTRAVSPGTYRSSLTVTVPQGSLTIPVTLVVSPTPVLLTDRGILAFDPTSLLLPLAAGLSNGGGANIVPSNQPPWLTIRGSGQNFITSADPVRAGPTLSAGTVRLTSVVGPSPANNPLTLPVIYLGSGLASRPPLTASPSALTFTESGTQTVSVAGGAFTATSSSPCVTASVSDQALSVTAHPAGPEGTRTEATVVLSANGVLQLLPVSFTVGPSNLTKVVNAASYAEGGIAPGEVVALFGSNIGPCALTTLTLDANGFVSSTLAGTQVTFNGVAAPLIYVSANQVAAVVPYELDWVANVEVKVTVGGRQSNTVTVPVVASAPGIFTADASGTGPAASFKTGEVVTLYLTGEGQTDPAGVNGQVTSNPPLPKLSVAATIDGEPAEVLFAGQAPGIVAGVMQVNLRAAAGIRSGPVPVVVTVGGVPTQTGVTVSIR